MEHHVSHTHIRMSVRIYSESTARKGTSQWLFFYMRSRVAQTVVCVATDELKRERKKTKKENRDS